MPDWLGIPAGIIAWGFALYVFLIAPKTLASRLLVTMLVVDGIAVISSYDNSSFIDPMFGLGELRWWQIHQASDWAVITVYLAFIGVTVRSPLARIFRGTRVRLALLTTGAVLALSMFLLDKPQLTAMMPALYVAIALVLTWGFAAAIHAWVIARDRASRARARAFTFAFGVRDVIWMMTFLASAARSMGLLDQDGVMDYIVPRAYALAVIVYVPLVAYGMLRTQLFDIDLRIRWTIKQSTLATIVVTFVFLVSEGADRFLSAEFGNFAGLLAAAVVVFFLTPLQRFAEGVASAAMPNTQNTPEYVAHRKMQVYESALAESQLEGGISDKERALLNRLRDSLGISSADAEALERELQPGSASR